MGIHVHLDIDAGRIDPSEWAAAWDETLRLLQAHPGGLLSLARRTILGSELLVYAPEISCDADDPSRRHWHVVGDRASLQTAESHLMYRDLAHYGHRTKTARGGRAHSSDILLRAREDGGWNGAARVLGDKTQGGPIHLPVLAAATVVEARFPGRAVAHGDIDRSDGQQAVQWASAVLGREVPLPVLVDGPAFVRRVRGVADTPAVDAAVERFLGEPADLAAAAVSGLTEGEANAFLARSLVRSGRDRRHFEGLLAGWLDADGDLERLCRVVCAHPAGPKLSAVKFIDALVDAGAAGPEPDAGFVENLHRLAAAPPVVVRAMAEIVLGSARFGHRLRVRPGRARVEAALAAVAGPAEFARAIARLDKRCAKESKALRNLGETVRELACKPWRDDDSHAAERLCVTPPAKLDEYQRLLVEPVAYAVWRARNRLREPSEGLEETVFGERTAALRSLARLVQNGRRVLTTDAWAQIEAEQDPEVIRFLCCLAALENYEMTFWQVSRALFENAELRRDATRASLDEARMQEVARRIAAAAKGPDD